MARETEYGGQDTDRTQGIQPLQEDATLGLVPGAITRLLYATDPADPDSIPDRNARPVYHKTAWAPTGGVAKFSSDRVDG